MIIGRFLNILPQMCALLWGPVPRSQIHVRHSFFSGFYWYWIFAPLRPGALIKMRIRCIIARVVCLFCEPKKVLSFLWYFLHFLFIINKIFPIWALVKSQLQVKKIRFWFWNLRIFCTNSKKCNRRIFCQSLNYGITGW